MSLHAVAVTLAEANVFVGRLHRHASPVRTARFQGGVADADELLRGVVIVTNPTAPAFQCPDWFEINRLCTDGARNACSFLYTRATVAARALGFVRGYTYTLKSEAGSSLRALRELGWYEDAALRGRDWARESGKSGRASVSGPLVRWRIDLVPERPPLRIPAEDAPAVQATLEGLAA